MPSLLSEAVLGIRWWSYHTACVLFWNVCLFFWPQKALEVKREEYERLPGWKQVNLKKAKGLF